MSASSMPPLSTTTQINIDFLWPFLNFLIHGLRVSFFKPISINFLQTLQTVALCLKNSHNCKEAALRRKFNCQSYFHSVPILW